MSGEVRALCYVCIDLLSRAKDEGSIPILASLLEDSVDSVRGGAAAALFRIAKQDKELKKQIEKIEFPKASLSRVRSTGSPQPSWVIVKEDSVESQ